ncbi:MAG: hypothetical protein H6613_17130 [Ignavibacteriales bacterium]|nr:hypothetical protein [Ignavibacteriales bacterium]
MWIKTIDVNVNIQDQVAETHVDQIFYNEMNTSVEAIYLFPTTRKCNDYKHGLLVQWAKVRSRN